MSQQDVIAFLSDGASYGKPEIVVERIDTHISVIFLVADRAYKLKRAVMFSYLDYSTVALREKYCKAELELNRRTAPDIYLGVRAIGRDAHGNLVFDDGTIIDWVVEMRRFSQGDLFDHMAEARKLTPQLMRDLTDVIVDFHTAAEVTPDYGGRAGIEEAVTGNRLNLRRACPPFATQEIEDLHAASLSRVAAIGALLDRRRDAGKVRRCHGDLHLRNICLFHGRPTPFDCIEFNDSLSCIDVLYDLAFLLMDLIHRDQQHLANIVFNRYVDLTADLDGLAALPLFMSIRAAVRAHVSATGDRESPSRKAVSDARSYLSLARAVLHTHPPRLIAIGGLSGVGKSTMAQALAADFLPAPGARVMRSDVLRKRLFGVKPETRLPPSAYGDEITERVYRTLREQAAASLAAGYTTIVDATFLEEEERHRIAALAAAHNIPFVGLWLEASAEVLAARIGARSLDASDADALIVRKQLERATGAVGWYRIDAGGDIAATLAAIRAVVEPPGCGRPC